MTHAYLNLGWCWWPSSDGSRNEVEAVDESGLDGSKTVALAMNADKWVYASSFPILSVTAAEACSCQQ